MQLIVKNKNIKNADGFLFGLKDFSTEDTLITIEELKEMDCSKVFISIDKNIFNSDLTFLENILISLEKLNIKGVLFYDLAVLSIAGRLNLNINLIWNQTFLVTNYKTCNYYQKEGVKGAVISSEITLHEIKNIANSTTLDLFVNIFGYQPMAFSKRKLLSNYFDYINEDNDKELNYMIERNKKYPVIEGDLGTKFVSPEILCGIRYINELKKAGIKYLLLDSNLIEEDIFNKIYNIFVKSLNSSDEQLLSLEREINSLVTTSLGFFDNKTIYKVKRND